MLKMRSFFILLLLLAVFAVGIGRLFILRFEKGDIYPAYSTMRADPLGAKVLYGALRETEGLNVTRNLRSLHLLPKEGRETIFYLGMPLRYLDRESDLDELDARVRAGARLILSFRPEKESFDLEKEAAEQKKWEKLVPSTKKEEKEPLQRSDLWKIEVVSLKQIDPATTSDSTLEKEISGHSFTAFLPQHSAWKTLYASDGKPVMIERAYGLGSLVLCADSWIFSNEALRVERCPRLLARIVGDRQNIIFDETHHGIHEEPGIASLARRYQLHGALAVCLLLGFLFVWRNAVPLVPSEKLDAGAEIETVSGHDSATGLTSLLRRSISAKNLAATCLAEWRKAPPRPVSAASLETADALAADPAKSPLERYQSLYKLLSNHAKRT